MESPIPPNEQKMSFPGQYHDEEIVLIKRRHPIVLLGMALYLAVMILLPLFAYFVLISLTELSLDEGITRLLMFFSGFYFLFFTALAFCIVIDYYLDIWIITDQRIMSVEQRGFFNRRVNEVRYERIQDITSVVSGLIPTYFQFGNILIQTAAESERMALKQVPDPVETRRVIAEAYKKAMDKLGGSSQIKNL